MSTNPNPIQRVRPILAAALGLGLGLAAFAATPTVQAADWHDHGGGRAHATVRDFHGGHYYRGGRGYYGGGVGLGFSFYDPYAYPYGYNPYFYGDPGYPAPPPVVYAPPPESPAPAPLAAAPPAAPDYTAANGQTCRDYQTTATIDGAQQQVHGTMCQQPDGSWHVAN